MDSYDYVEPDNRTIRYVYANGVTTRRVKVGACWVTDCEWAGDRVSELTQGDPRARPAPRKMRYI